jgi:uncharacterized membrane protein
MVLMRLTAILALFILAVPAAPAAAHENHQKEQIERAEKAGGVSTPGAMQERMEDHMEEMEEQRPRTFPERLMSWIGRTHPFAVHFPIALFPVAWVALVLARRRGETVELIRALIIVAGAASVIAALLGWFTGGFVLVDTDPIQLWHRWVGTGLAIIGGAVALWALRRRNAVNSRGMVVALGGITLILLVQGWLGAALVHGMGHMNF